MRYTPVYTKQFTKDVRKAQKRGKNFDKFKIIAETLLSDQPLNGIYRDHKVAGSYVGRKEYHIALD